MGGKSSSTVKAESITKSSVDIITTAIMECKEGAYLLQTLKIRGDGNTVNNRQVMTYKLSSTCIQDSTSIIDLQARVANELSAKAMAAASGIVSLGIETNSNINQKIRTEVKQKLTQETIMQIVNNTMATQELIIEGNRNYVSNEQNMTAEIVRSNVQTVLTNFKSIQDLTSKIQGEGEAKITNPISDIIDSIGNLFNLGMLLIIAAVLVGVLLFKDQLLGMFGMAPNGPNTTTEIEVFVDK